MSIVAKGRVAIISAPDGMVLAFTTREAQQLTGLSARKLQYWDETDFIRPSVAARQGRGAPRLYAFRDLIQLRVAAQLRAVLSLHALRRLQAALDVESPFASLRFGVTPSQEVVYMGPTGQTEAARYPGQITMQFDVPVKEIRADLETRIHRLRQRHGVGRIAAERGTLSGQARIAGTRISVDAVTRLVDAGWSPRKIKGEYPELRTADIEAAIAAKRAG
jgi:uncharacterized protein (DUF433 family)